MLNYDFKEYIYYNKVLKMDENKIDIEKENKKCKDCSYWFLNRSGNFECCGDEPKQCQYYLFRWDYIDNRYKYI